MTKKAPKPHTMWIVATPFGDRLWPYTGILSFQRKGAIEQCERVLGQKWADIRKHRAVRCLKISLKLPSARP